MHIMLSCDKSNQNIAIQQLLKIEANLLKI